MELRGLQEGLLPRRLTSTQRRSLTEELSRGEKGKIVIRFLSGNAECQNFATDIAEVLQSCGWTVAHMSAVISIGVTVSVGLRVTVQDPQTPRTIALLSAFEHIGISVPVKIHPTAHPPVHLIVGNTS